LRPTPSSPRAQRQRTGQAVAAELRGRRAAQHFQLLGALEVEQADTAGREGAEGEALRRADAVDEDQHLVAFQAADVDAFVAGAAGGGAR
jgi:tRNA(Ile)-lysidine synthase TilS/MesJ